MAARTQLRNKNTQNKQNEQNILICTVDIDAYRVAIAREPRRRARAARVAALCVGACRVAVARTVLHTLVDVHTAALLVLVAAVAAETHAQYTAIDNTKRKHTQQKCETKTANTPGAC